MAEKEATVYIVDVGKSMKQHNNGRDISDLDWAMRYVWDKITTTVSTTYFGFYLGVRLITSKGSDWSQNGYNWCCRAQD